MKRLTKRIVLFLLILIVGLSGYLIGYISRPVYHIPLTQALEASPKAKLFDGNYSDRAFVSEIDIIELLPMFREAEWSNKNVMRKGNWNLLLDNGTKISLSYYGAFYWIDKIPGYFIVQEEDRDNYKEVIRRLINERVISWRTQRNADELLNQ